jgi:formate hydrogenlyase subunit 3/multisubunit Na+/H+ antiporter MnhD subunit
MRPVAAAKIAVRSLVRASGYSTIENAGIILMALGAAMEDSYDPCR